MKRYILAFLTTAALGTALHFLYARFPIPLFAVFAPINESVWEHLKLLYWPFLVGALVLRDHRLSFWGNVCITLLLLPPILLGAYYILVCGLGIRSPALDIWIYYITIAIGFVFLHHMDRKTWTDRQVGIFIMLAALWGSSLFILSALPPNLPIFRS